MRSKTQECCRESNFAGFVGIYAISLGDTIHSSVAPSQATENSQNKTKDVFQNTMSDTALRNIRQR